MTSKPSFYWKVENRIVSNNLSNFWEIATEYKVSFSSQVTELIGVVDFYLLVNF